MILLCVPMFKIAVLIVIFLVTLTPVTWACADGCGVFDVSTSSALPTDSGGNVWVEYNHANQHIARHGTSKASSDDELHHKRVRNNYYNLGGQYMVNRAWGMRAVAPLVDRNVTSEDHDTEELISARRVKVGDIRLTGIYSGFSPDMSTGVTFGVKLPTGDYTDSVLDRDTAIGTGSTNIQLGGYHMGRINAEYGWFTNTMVDAPVLYKKNYRPGAEVTAAIGAYKKGWELAHHIRFTPILQVIGSKRWQDAGLDDEEHEHASGYTQLLLSPGFEIGHHDVTLYGDVSVPVYRKVNGTQLTAPVFAKIGVRYRF